jgi:cytochrome c-type biogenesis protein CcmH
MKKLSSLLCIFLLGFSLALQAKVESREFASEQMEEDYKTLVAELRCLVCQNQNLADSNAELAVDMRNKVYSMLNEGKSKTEIADFMVARYGDFVLYRPPVKSSTFMLWFGPFIFLLVGALIAVSYVRRQQKSAQSVVDTQTQKRAHSLLDDD